MPPPPRPSSSSSSAPKTLTLARPATAPVPAPAPAGTLIPALPDDLAALILASVPISHHPRIRCTSRAWLHFLHPRRLLPLRRLLRLPPRHLLLLLLPPATALLFDPAAPAAWLPLPPLPASPSFYGLAASSLLSIPPSLFLLGGSHFDARDFPLGRPRPSPAALRLDLRHSPPAWHPIPDLPTPRGSFACVSYSNSILVAGGGSRHPMYPSEGTRLSSAEIFDVRTGEWRAGEAMPRQRAGCVGFVVPQGEYASEDEFWVMGGYGEYVLIADVVPASVYCRDAVAMGLRSGKWRVVGDMWEVGERDRLGPVAVVDGEEEGGRVPAVYMLDRSTIFRYDFASNRWWKESCLRRMISENEPCNFVAMNGELYVLTSPEPPGTPKKRPSLEIQAYDPKRRKWRLFRRSPPFEYPVDLKSAVTCTIRV